MYNEMMDTIGLVNTVDPELAAAMDRELNRQRQNIELIAGAFSAGGKYRVRWQT